MKKAVKRDHTLSVVYDADLLLLPVPTHAGDHGGEEGVEVRPKPGPVLLNVDLQLGHSGDLVAELHSSPLL